MIDRLLRVYLMLLGATGVVLLLFWSMMVRMPGTNVTAAAPLSADEEALREILRRHVQQLAGEIGERNLLRYPQLVAAAEFIESSFRSAGLEPRRDTYELGGVPCHNIEAEIPANPPATSPPNPGMVIVGAHYDSVFGCPGANDNGSGVAALLALAQRFAQRRDESRCALRFVAFVNEEPPYFQSETMGSHVYASRCKQRGDDIAAMISLETIAYFSDARGSQRYPAPVLGAFYPRTGNFIGFVANTQSRKLLRRALATFRRTGKIPSEGAALPGFIPGVGWSDHWSFWQHGYPAIMITDTAPFRYPHYHLPSDTPDKLDYDRFALVVSGMETVIADLAQRPTSNAQHSTPAD